MRYDDPNRPEWTGRAQHKNFARIYASCKGERLSDGKPHRTCAKCGLVSRKRKCPVCGCTVFKKLSGGRGLKTTEGTP